MAIFSKKRGSRPRRIILKSVYEENLRILGKNPLGPRWKFPYLFKGYFFLSFIVLLVLGNVDYLDSRLFSENKKEIHISTQGENFVPAEYISLINDKKISMKQMFGLGVKTIVIDPGHGGSDPGTSGKLGLKEKDITLDIARRLKKKLLAYGQYKVLLTREDDETVPLNRRTEIAARSKADVFISIHVNYVPSKPINIIETYYFGPSADGDTLELASAENAHSNYSLGEFKEMIEKIGDTLKLQESRRLASFIQDSLYLNIKGQNSSVLDYGIKRAPFVVLLGIDMPGVLTEVSCISNKKEELKLYTTRYREDIAQYLESGILNYLKKGEPVYEASR
ncbi:MAG: N-acetylmuramoyl-L-alanine amidase [Thermodesulfovibrionales bacterium]|nr:N-acetylmuramoyl-L-alanine amidase [Thermodesulfovibrionales bacterium]